MSETDDITARLQARAAAYLGYRDKTPTADLLPTKTMPTGLLDPDCRDVAGFLVARVRETYVRCRRNSREIARRRPDRYGHFQLDQWDGGYDWRGQYHVPIWVKIARAILDRGLDVKGFVTWQFARAETAGSPYPNELLSPTAPGNYEREEQREVTRLRDLDRRVMANQLQRGISQHRGMQLRAPGAAVIGALRDPTIGVSAFLRYWFVAACDRPNAEFQEIMRRYRGPALREYAGSVQSYEATYSHDLLADFRTVVTLVRVAFEEIVEGDQGRWTPPPVESSPDNRRPRAGKSEG